MQRKYLRRNFATSVKHCDNGKGEIISFVIEAYGKLISNFNTQTLKETFCVEELSLSVLSLTVKH